MNDTNQLSNKMKEQMDLFDGKCKKLRSLILNKIFSLHRQYTLVVFLTTKNV